MHLRHFDCMIKNIDEFLCNNTNNVSLMLDFNLIISPNVRFQVGLILVTKSKRTWNDLFTVFIN